MQQLVLIRCSEVPDKENKQIIQQIVRAILFLAKQGLPFRGDVEDEEIREISCLC
jgi:hypothetical protein